MNADAYVGTGYMMDLGETARAVAGAAHGHARYAGVTTDSRAVNAGDLFVALRGERFDGNEYVEEAFRRGAAAALTSRHIAPGTPLPQVVVADTRIALGRLAAHWRARFALPLVALTGSNGKTTVKEMISAVLAAHVGTRAAVLATEGNLNNDIGMPLTLLKLREAHRFAVIEMGMNHAGEIDYLTRIARPSIALVNNAQRAHVGILGSVEAIARAKGEIYAGLAPSGIALVNQDDAFSAYWKGLTARRPTIPFGLGEGATVRAVPSGPGITVTTPLGPFTVALQVRGERRKQRRRGPGGSLVIDDSYNANPESMKAAAQVLAEERGRKVLVMGDMGELGADAAAMHAEVGSFARAAGIDALMALGEASRHAVQAFGQGALHFDDVEALTRAARREAAAGAAILVKGSRFMRMERIADALAGDGGGHAV